MWVLSTQANSQGRQFILVPCKKLIVQSEMFAFIWHPDFPEDSNFSKSTLFSIQSVTAQ